MIHIKDDLRFRRGRGPGTLFIRLRTLARLFREDSAICQLISLLTSKTAAAMLGTIRMGSPNGEILCGRPINPRGDGKDLLTLNCLSGLHWKCMCQQDSVPIGECVCVGCCCSFMTRLAAHLNRALGFMLEWSCPVLPWHSVSSLLCNCVVAIPASLHIANLGSRSLETSKCDFHHVLLKSAASIDARGIRSLFLDVMKLRWLSFFLSANALFKVRLPFFLSYDYPPFDCREEFPG